MYYNAPKFNNAVAAPQHLYTTAQAPGMYYPPHAFYPNHPFFNHRGSVGPRHYNQPHWNAGPQAYQYQRTAVPQNYHRYPTVPQVPVAVPRPVPAPEVIYSTPQPAAPSYTYPTAYNPQPRGLVVDTYKTPTWTQDQSRNYAPRPSPNPVLGYSSTGVLPSPRRRVPVYDTKYIRSLNWPGFWPQMPLARSSAANLRCEAPPKPRQELRIAFDLKKRIPRKEGVPLSFLMQEDVSTLKRVIDRPHQQVLRTSGLQTITLRFWSPIHPYPVQEYKVPVDPRCESITRLVLAKHIEKAYTLFFKAAACAPLSSESKGGLKKKTIGPRAVSIGHLWLVSLRGTEREGVYDVGVQNHGPQASSLW